MDIHIGLHLLVHALKCNAITRGHTCRCYVYINVSCQPQKLRKYRRASKNLERPPLFLSYWPCWPLLKVFGGLIYVNNILYSTHSNILSFADDTSLYLRSSNLIELFREANISMNSIYEWFCANQLSLNGMKTKYIVTRAQHFHCN